MTINLNMENKNKGIEALLEPNTIVVPVTKPKYWDLIGMYHAEVIQGCENYPEMTTITFQHYSKCLDHYHAYVKKK